ncbi:hypothetical protein FOA52_013911 [Chlamydomonas sp. UWO 241]|nr:hypothetical protein FOA52_013911 [Chlamydomonas sp. UWO 241]
MTRSKARKHSAAAGALIARAATTTESPAQAQQIASLVDVVSLLVSRVPGAPMQMPHAEPARARAGHAAHSAAPRAAPAAEAAQPARPAAAAAPVASAAGAPAAERPAAAGAARATSARGPSRWGGLPARVGETSLCRSHVLSIPVAAATRLIAGRGSEGQMARDGIVRGALRDASYLGSTRHVRRLFSDCYGSEETAVAAAAVRVAAAAVDGVSLPVCLAMNLVRFVHDVSGRDRPAGGGVVSASFLNAKPAVGGIGVEPRRGGVLRVLFTVASDAVADTVVRSRRNLRDVDPSAAVFDVLSDREEAQHRALWPAFLAAKAAGKRAQFHRARLVVDGERDVTARAALPHPRTMATGGNRRPATTVPEPPSHAFYYPNLCNILDVKVLGVPTVASHDVGAASHEQRHFIDSAFLASLPGGEALLGALVTPQPPCASMHGTNTPGEERVLGMLPGQLSLTFKYREDPPPACSSHEAQRVGRKCDLLLAHVLVVDALPVPLHLSVKAIDQAASTGEIDSDAIAPLWAAAGTAGRGGRKLDASHMPERYRIHPYWSEGKVLQVGLSNSVEEMSAALSQARGNDAAAVRECGNCGQTAGKLKKCGRCEASGRTQGAAFYCCRECQLEAWPEHKLHCPRPSRVPTI